MTTDDAITTRQVQHVSSTVNHPRMERAGPESVRRFLNVYDQYVKEVKARVRQLGDGFATEASNPVDLKWCVDIDVLKFSISLALIEDVAEYEDLTEKNIRRTYHIEGD